MKLACEAVVPGLNCDFVAEGDSVDVVHAAMMSHGGEKHSDLMAGKTAEEMEAMSQQMSVRIRQLIVDNN
jgi:predicted small metal-binding protein